jgi:DNA-directed RNA polymerase alpha subunit
MAKKVLLQVLKSWNEGVVLQVGARVSVDASRANAMIRRGYARRVAPGEAYDYPAEKPEHKFQKIDIEEPEVKKEAPIDPGELPAEITIPAISELAFISDIQANKLSSEGIKAISDLGKWNQDKLMGIKYIGKSTAKKLMDAYNQYINVDHHKDSDMEITDK